MKKNYLKKTDPNRQPNQFLYFEEKSLVSFDIICEELFKKFNCTYISYALEMRDGKRVHYYSNRKWQQTFINEHLIDSCPLIKFARETNATILEWNSLSGFLNNKQKKVMEARKEFNIGNGVGIKNSIYGMCEMSTFSSTVSNIRFYSTFLQNIVSFKKYIFQLRTLAIASMIISGWLPLSNVNFNLQDLKNINDAIH